MEPSLQVNCLLENVMKNLVVVKAVLDLIQLSLA